MWLLGVALAAELWRGAVAETARGSVEAEGAVAAGMRDETYDTDLAARLLESARRTPQVFADIEPVAIAKPAEERADPLRVSFHYVAPDEPPSGAAAAAAAPAESAESAAPTELPPGAASGSVLDPFLAHLANAVGQFDALLQRAKGGDMDARWTLVRLSATMLVACTMVIAIVVRWTVTAVVDGKRTAA